MQPTAVSKNSRMNSTSSTVREALQPLRQSRSANSSETNPVRTSADVKNKNSRQPRRRRGGGAATMVGPSAILFEPVDYPLELGIHRFKPAVREPEQRDEQQRKARPHHRHAHVGHPAQVRQRGDGAEVERARGHLRELETVSYTHLRAHETRHDLVCRL